MPKPRTILGLLLAALLLAAGSAWVGRDLPRWALERLLARAVSARVELGDVAELKPRRLVLRGLEVEAIAALPVVETLAIGELRVEASSLRELVAGRFEQLVLRGLDVRLVPAPFELRDEPLPFTAGELVLEPATIRLLSARGETVLSAEGILRHVGGHGDGGDADRRGAAGTLTFRSPKLELEPLLALASAAGRSQIRGLFTELTGELEIGGGATELTVRAAETELAAADLGLELPGLVAEATIAGDRSEVAVTSTAARAALGGERRVDLGAAGVRAVFTPAAGSPGALRVELFPRVSFLTAAEIAGDWDPGTRRLLRLAARLDGLRLDRFDSGHGIEGDADLELRGDGERLAYTLTVRPVRLIDASTPDRDRSWRLRTPGARLTVEGEAAFPDLAADRDQGASNLLAAFAGPLTASLEVPSASGRWGEIEVPAAALPFTARFEGRLVAGTPAAGTPAAGTPAAVHGTASLESGAAGRLTAGGVLTLGNDRDSGGEPAAEVVWRWRGARLSRLLPLLDHLGLAVEGVDALRPAGRLAAAGRLRGPLSRPGVEATVTLEDLAADGETWAVAAGTAEAQLRISGSGLRLRSLAATGELTVPPLGPIPLTLAARGTSDLDLAAGRLEEAVLETPALGRLRLQGDWRTAGGEVLAAGRVTAEELEVPAWQQALGADAGGLALGGRVAAELTAELRSAGVWQLAGPVCLAGAGFSSPFGTRVMEGLAATAVVRIDGGPGTPVTGRTRGRGGAFLLLWDAFFADFSQVKADFEVTATAQSVEAEPSLWLRGSVEVPGGPRIAATLERPRGGEPSYRLALDDGDLATTHERYLRQVLRQRFGEAELGGGVSARLRGGRAVDGTWTLGGDVRVIDLGWTSTSGEIAVAGLDLILPLDLRLPGGESATGRRRHSRLRFDRFALRGLELPPTDSGLWVEGDAVGIDEPIELAILNGKLILERLTLRRLLAPGRTLESGLALESLSLEEISRALQIFPLEGKVDGTFPRMRLSANELRIEGGGEIALFGGRIQVRDISGEEIFTRFPKLTLSADFQDIDLGRFTRRIDFGEMSGVLQGSITGCELFRGIPVRCRGYFETVHQPGVARTVDVKAINNLTILGTGAGIGFLDRGIRRFFKRYTYDRLGVDVDLDQDVLLLRGLELRGERELFLRGRLPFPIDVVNAQPGKTVSFQTMLRRLKSLEVGGATRSPR